MYLNLQNKHKDLPILPKFLFEIQLESDCLKLTSDQKRFLIFDSNDHQRILIFGLNSRLEILSKADRWHVDGEFKSSPTLYAQLYTIHAWLLEQMHVCAFVLTPDRQKSTYIKMIKGLRSSSSFKFDPKEIVSDYEIVAIKAFNHEFPKVKFKGCHFHFTQAIWKNIQEKGLSNDFRSIRVVKEPNSY